MKNSNKKLNILSFRTLISYIHLQINLKDIMPLFALWDLKLEKVKLNFKKLIINFPLNFARLGLMQGIKSYSLLSSKNANQNGQLLYTITKGKLEHDIKQLGLKQLTIFKPGAIINRDNDFRILEFIY